VSVEDGYVLSAVSLLSGWEDCSMNLIFMFPCIMTQYTKMTNKMQLC